MIAALRPRGLELNSVTDGKGDSYDIGGICVGTESGTDREFLGTDGLIFDAFAPDLQQVIDAWPTLPETVRQDILAMVQSTVNATEDEYFGKTVGAGN